MADIEVTVTPSASSTDITVAAAIATTALEVSAGIPGASAYQVAVANGYPNSEAEWLATLVGPAGQDGSMGQTGDVGPQGYQGDPGASAYQVAVSNGFTGTEAEWLASLVGPQGEQGPQGPAGSGSSFDQNLNTGDSPTFAYVHGPTGVGFSEYGSSGGAGGTINVRGGDGCSGDNGAGGNAGSINLSGGSSNAGGYTVGSGGSIDMHGAGGYNDSSGGSLNTSEGGGSIDTRGTGLIELGWQNDAGNGFAGSTRTSLRGTATAHRDIYFPNDDGTLVLDAPSDGTAYNRKNGAWFAATSFSGAYADLTGKPSLFSGAWADLTGKPSFAAVATSGSATDLSTGTINAARLPSSVAILTAANTFTAAQTIASGTLTASTPAFTATQTWNAGAVAFTAIKANVTDTASASTSLLLDLQVGGTSVFKVDKSGSPILGSSANYRTVNAFICNRFMANNTAVYVGSSAFIGFTANALAEIADADTKLFRDAANTLAMRNGTVGQTARIFGTWTDASNGRWLSISNTTAGLVTLTATGNGTGASGNLLKLTAPILLPSSSVSLATNGDLAFEATSNTTLTIRYRGSDGTTRSAALTLA